MNKELITRINEAGDNLEVSRRELGNAFWNIYQKNDVVSLKKLFYAYQSWEIRVRNPGTSYEQAEDLAIENILVVTEFYDAVRSLGDEVIAAKIAIENSRSNNYKGETSRFVISNLQIIF